MKDIRNFIKYGSIFTALLLALAGCISLGLSKGGGEAQQLYTLTAPRMDDTSIPKANWQLLVESFTSDAALDTARIALKTSPYTFDYYADVSWTEEAPSLVQKLLVESFENAKKLKSVSGDSLSIRADYALKVELRDFQAEYPGKPDGIVPNIRVRFSIKMITLPQRTVIASRIVERNIRAAGTTFKDIIHTYDEALGQVMQDTVHWTLDTGNSYKARKK